MPEIEVDGARLYYTDTGSGDETIVFSHGLLFSSAIFEKQIDHLKDRYRCIAYDHRGQGKSSAAVDGYDMDTQTEDAAALMNALEAGPCHFVGLSMGGFVAMRLAIRRPELLRSIVLMETSADPEPAENVPKYRRLNWVARWIGLWPVVGRVMPIMFGRTFLSDPARADERAFWKRQILRNNRDTITRAVDGVIRRQGIHEDLGRIDLPALVLVGDEDVATVPAKAERLHEAIGGSKLVHIPRAGHSSSVEEPAAVNAALDAFLAETQT
ncbi:MAG TPA: alpha/beta hydrolase [Afifellaceae bacterium]|nr:alpha/beta hydrolase [Afifellaceae bacterium]